MSNTLNTESLKKIIHAHNESILIEISVLHYTGIDEIDNIIIGIKAGQVIVIGGRPGSGKTMLALNILSNVCKMYPSHHVCYYSLELSKKQLFNRIKDLNIEDFERLLKSDIHICDKINISLEDIENNVVELYSRSLLRIVIIDYIQLIKNCTKKKMWDKLKSIAIEENIAIIVLSQLKRSFSENYDKNRPLDYLYKVVPKPKKIDHIYLIDKPFSWR